MNAKEKLNLIGLILSSSDSSSSCFSRIANYVDSNPEEAIEGLKSRTQGRRELSDNLFKNIGSWCKKVDRNDMFENIGSWCKKVDNPSLLTKASNS